MKALVLGAVVCYFVWNFAYILTWIVLPIILWAIGQLLIWAYEAYKYESRR